jgi:tRNA/tmRNA/rRNA uracil-C5-methylase (TrmA/RlmC/RlmD family)
LIKSWNIRSPIRWQIFALKRHHKSYEKIRIGFGFRKTSAFNRFHCARFLVVSNGELVVNRDRADSAAAGERERLGRRNQSSVSEAYTGDLSIFEDENRAKNLQIDRVMDILNIKEGKSVADLGAGSGWFTVRAARRVGAAGRVFAVEINQDYINHINDRAKRENFTNIQTVLGTEDDPKLAANSVDSVLI